MEQELSLFKSEIELDPSNPQLPHTLKKLKLSIFSKLANNPNAFEQYALHFSELEVTYYLLRKHIDEFVLAIERLMKFYNQGLESKEKAHFTGIYLIYLLSYNKFPEFYSQIELLSKETFQNAFVHFVIQLEYKLSIGSYSNLLGDYQPTGIENVFLDRIMDTIRLQTALNSSASYTQVSHQQALKLFNVKNINELQQYALKHQFQWRFDGNYVYFDNIEKIVNPLNSEFLINNTLRFVNEFDKII